MKPSVSRRSFLARGMLGGAGMVILPSARSAWSYQANERLRLAIVGDMYVAGHFFSAGHAYDGLEIAALCHTDERKPAEMLAAWRQRADAGAGAADAGERRAADYYRRLADHPPPVFADFRRMLDTRGDGIDAVVTSVFDHLHGVVCGAAMRAGKHVFCERPLGLRPRESRALRDLAARQGVATSIRNPGNASGRFRRGVELIREGTLGPIREVHVWFPRGGADHRQPPQDEHPVPERLHWDLWLGPAAWRPYHPAWMAYAQWRDFSNGGIGTFGPHAANLAFMGLKVHALWEPAAHDATPAAIRVEAECSGINHLSFPLWERVRWEVPARAGLPPVTFTWHQGPAPELSPGSRTVIESLLEEHGVSRNERARLLRTAGALILGSEGAMVSDDHNVDFTLLPEERFRDVEQDGPTSLPASRGHYVDWLAACRGGPPPWATFDYAAPLSEFLMLANVATRFEGPLDYNPLHGSIENHAEADAALGYVYRKGWHL